MATRRWMARAAVLLAAIGSASALMAAAPRDDTKPTDAEAPNLTLPQQAEDAPQDWYAPLKNMKIGPGTLSIDGQFRTRWEHYNDYTIQGYNRDEHDEVLMIRTWLGFDYRLSEDAHAYVMFQDARSYVSDLNRERFPLTSPYFDQVDVRKAYVEWKHIGGSPIGFKVGRQALDYGDRRLLGPSNWGNVGGFWWDAAKMYIDTEPVQVDLFYGQRVIREQIRWDNRHFDFDAMGAYAHFKNLPCTLDAFYILRYDDHGNARGERGTTGDIRRHTLGVHTAGNFLKNWDYAGTLAAQFGTQGGDDVEAYGANARLGYTWLDCPWKPRVAGEFTYASGDRSPADGENNTFDNLFTAPTTYYGRMNLLSWQNMMDYQATFEVKPTKKLKAWVDYHFFRLASDTDAWYWFSMAPQRRDRTGNSGHELGHEIDIQIKWTVSKNLELYAGYSWFLPGSFVKHTAGGDDAANWGFVQCTYKF
ncbi:MAG TPA: alginate export family protein [Phycisphaerae bacterium]|nr:alginate export family protein [Phycisphaerae bacterium]